MKTIIKLTNDKKNPLVSIITITYNSERTIKETFESVLSQAYTNIEYIIVDGNSSDNTISIINSYKAKFVDRNITFKFLSEDDDGIADAWNKGLKLATGDIISMLNSDDWFDKNSINNAVNCLDIDNAELTYGICKRVNEKGKVVQVMSREFNPKRIYLNFGFSFTSCFMTKKVYEIIGDYDCTYKIAIDTDFLLRSFRKQIPFKKCNNIVYMRLGGVSTKYKRMALYEHQKALKANGFNIYLIFLFGLIKKTMLALKKN
jgi:glycosyltransferase involved in cell wall biosynthesis